MTNPANRRFESVGPGRRVPCRRFTVLDGMILVAGGAIGFAGYRSKLSELVENWGEFGAMPKAAALLDHSGFVLMCASLLILILRLRRPRPTLWRIARQPGVAACFAMLASRILCQSVNLSYQVLLGDGLQNPRRSSWIYSLLNPLYEDAYIVAVLWSLFAIGRIGRPEAGWIDRAGRVVGWIWIAWGVFGSCLSKYWE